MKQFKYLFFPALFVLVGLIAAVNLFQKGLIVSAMDERTPWGIWEAAYIFCTGLSAGSFVISVLGMMGIQQFKPISRIAVVQAILLLLMAPIFLWMSMGKPWRFLNIYMHPNPASAISWGAYLLVIYPLICVAYAYYQMSRDIGKPIDAEAVERNDRRARMFGLAGIPVAIMVHGYTGVLLGFIKARVLWNTPMMPVLFLTSAVVSGLALLIINIAVLNALFEFEVDQKVVRSLAKMMFFFLIFDLMLLVSEMLAGIYTPGKHFEAWSVLLRGRFALLFLGGEIFVGTLVPLLLLANTRRGHILRIIFASVLVMAGIFSMRCNIILGGQVVQAYGGSVSHYFPNLTEWMIMAGIFGFGTMLYALSVYLLPLKAKEEEGRV